MARLPQGFNSWVQVVDFLHSKNVRYQTLRMQHMEDNGEVTTRKLTLRTAERNAWREIEALRLNVNDTHYAISAIYNSTLTPDILQRIVTFLEKSQLNL